MEESWRLYILLATFRRHGSTPVSACNGTSVSGSERSKVSKRAWQFADASLLPELTCHVGSHSVTYHPTEVTFSPLLQPIKAGTRFIDRESMKG